MNTSNVTRIYYTLLNIIPAYQPLTAKLVYTLPAFILSLLVMVQQFEKLE